MNHSFSLIVACTSDLSIGYKDGRLPWHLPPDLQHFKRHTEHQSVLMGSKTFESLGRPHGLPNRHNWVLTRNPQKNQDHVSYISNIDAIDALPLNFSSEIWVIGGANVYEQALCHPSLSRIVLTRIITPSIINADIKLTTNLYNLDHFLKEQPSFQIKSQSEWRSYTDLFYQFVDLRKS